MTGVRRFIDIGANLTDCMYQGIYNGSKKHEPDLKGVLNRGWEGGLERIIVTGGSLEESLKALEIAKTDDRLYATVGCHPTRCNEFEESHTPEEYLEKLGNIARANLKVVAWGECGLDYDRLKFCPKDTQKKYFEFQLTLNQSLNLPLFLHCRNAATDLHEILSKYDNFRGVVHSFDGTIDEAQKFIDLGYYIGLNGCSLKTEQNLKTVKELPIDKIMIETDSPWCDIRPTHAGFKYVSQENAIPSVKKEKWVAECLVKGRNEPINIRQVLDIIAGVRNEPANSLCERIFQNTKSLFFQ
ncbi:deoxyribonuclease TATDN1 [Euwallacea fornicatus]|uniref:deoxyribonuclease TATDN1 n=1 Tax=Euwallacea fornicatus TaxID=995702 RepID=UPI00338DB5FA